MSELDSNNAITILRDIFWVGFHEKDRLISTFNLKRKEDYGKTKNPDC